MSRRLTLLLAVLSLLPIAGCGPLRFEFQTELAGCVQLLNIEGGCLVLNAQSGERFLLLGDRLPEPGLFAQVRGTVAHEAVTICMVGKPFRVTAFFSGGACP